MNAARQLASGELGILGELVAHASRSHAVAVALRFDSANAEQYSGAKLTGDVQNAVQFCDRVIVRIAGERIAQECAQRTIVAARIGRDACERMQ